MLPIQIGVADECPDAEVDQLTQRQILGGIVEGKTNYERDVAMGFSVSMIQHVTMRTYQALALNDWKEAAKSELILSLI